MDMTIRDRSPLPHYAALLFPAAVALGCVRGGVWLAVAPVMALVVLPMLDVVGHHRNVGLSQDPATARRGEPAYRFLVRSVVGPRPLRTS